MNISAMNSIQHAQWCQQSESIAASKRTSGKVRKHTQQFALALAGFLVINPTARAGLPPGLEVFNDMQEVSDADLGHMRGKFASNTQVMFFGVEMVSQWQTSSGSLVTADANLNIKFNNGTPTVQYVPTVTIVQGQGVLPNGNINNVSGGGGLNNVSGVSQSIQVAGQTNHINNDIRMEVDSFSAIQGGGTISGAVQSSAGSVSQTGSDGTVATITLANNSLGLAVTVPGQGEIMQQIRDQGLLQAVRIAGDLNQIHNQITMHVGLSLPTGFNSAGILTALQGTKGLPHAGMF